MMFRCKLELSNGQLLIDKHISASDKHQAKGIFIGQKIEIISRVSRYSSLGTINMIRAGKESIEEAGS